MTTSTNTRRRQTRKADKAVVGQPGAAAATAELDVSHATPELVSLALSYLHDQSSGDVDALLKHFDPDQVAVIDVVFGAVHESIGNLLDTFTQIGKTAAPGSQFYPTKVLGDEKSGVVFFTAEAAALGHELNGVGAYDFVDGLIRREVVYSDGRHFTRAAVEQAAPDRQPVEDFRTSIVKESAAREMKKLATKLAQALATGDSAAAVKLFASDAEFEDQTLHVSTFGTVSLQGFLDRALPALPYGEGSSLLHVLGSATGGGYEWTTDGPVRNGIIALEVDDDGLITHATAMWDGSLVSKATLVRLLTATIEDLPSASR